MGYSPLRLLREIELPLAAPVILAGIGVSVVIAIGTATIGSTVGAVTLGTPIIDGLVGDKLPYVIEGAVARRAAGDPHRHGVRAHRPPAQDRARGLAAAFGPYPFAARAASAPAMRPKTAPEVRPEPPG